MKKQLFEIVLVPAAFVLALGLTLAFRSPQHAFTLIVLSAVEFSISFDNMAVTTGLVGRLSRFWVRLYLTLGVLIAVLFVRLLLPILLVSLGLATSPTHVLDMAVGHPAQYAGALHRVYPEIAAFGGVFLMMLFLNRMINQPTEVRWIKPIEDGLAWLGKRVGRAEIILVIPLIILFGTISMAVVDAGCAGMLVFLLISCFPEPAEGQEAGSISKAAKLVGAAALVLFLRVEVIDASQSLDSVVAAFSISHDLLDVCIGLGLGALLVRSLTALAVRTESLSGDNVPYLEPAAHWAMGLLGGSMIVGEWLTIPDMVSGAVSMAVIAASLVYSWIEKKRRPRPSPAANAES